MQPVVLTHVHAMHDKLRVIVGRKWFTYDATELHSSNA